MKLADFAIDIVDLDILLVEDDPDTRANLCDILELDGYDVGVVGTAQEARAIPEWDRIRVIILDRRLPDATAEELLPEIRDRAPKTDVIVVTGYGDMESTVVALQHGAADYIIKPVNPDVLRKSVSRVIERRRIERALHQENELSDRILNTVDAGIALLDLDGKVVRINRFLVSLTGWTQDEAVGKDWFKAFLYADDRDSASDLFRNAAAGTEVSSHVHRLLAKDDSDRHFRWAASVLRDEQAEATAVLLIGTDITELMEAQESSLRSARLAAVGQTVAGMAHESRNALQRIQAATDMLSLDCEEIPTAMKSLQKIRRAARELHDLHEQVRNYAAPIRLNRVETMISGVWQRAWDDLSQIRSGREATLEEDITDLPRLPIDVMRLEQVFRNLFQNSLAACGDPVVIRVSCRQTVASCGAAVELRIRDNGPGLSPEQRARVFDAFFTTKTTGTGLGMAIVQRIIESHGGSISLGETSEGAEFVITLPREEGK